MSNQRKPNVALKCRPSSAMYSPVMKPVVDVEGQVGVAAGAGALDVGHAGEAVEIGDRVRFAGAGREHVEHFGARAERLDAAGDRPRVACAARGKRRGRPGDLSTYESRGAQPRSGDEELAAARRMPVPRLEWTNGDI